MQGAQQNKCLTLRAAEPVGEVTSSCLDDSSSFFITSCTTYCSLHHSWTKAVACFWIQSCTCSLVVPEHKTSSPGEPATDIFGSALVGILMAGTSGGGGTGWGLGTSSSLRPLERDFLNCLLPLRKMSDNFLGGKVYISYSNSRRLILANLNLVFQLRIWSPMYTTTWSCNHIERKLPTCNWLILEA